MEITCKCLWMLTGGKWDRVKESNRRVYDPDFISPTITAGGGGNLEVKIAIPQATKQGYIECEIGGVVDLSYPNSKTRRGRVQEGGSVSPTVTAESMGLCRLEPVCVRLVGRDPENPTARKVGAPTQQMVEPYQEDGCVGSLTTVQKDNMVMEPSIRIRKLTPRECWRLMGFDDVDFDKAADVNSNSQLYKQAGNSIVVDVLMAIFKPMVEDTDDE